MSHLDAALFPDLLPLLGADYESLRYTNETGVRAAFLEGSIEEPLLVYRDLELAELDERARDADAFLRVVEALSDSPVRRAYLPKLQEVQAKFRMLRAARDGDDRAAHEASADLYGLPQQEHYSYALRSLQACLGRVVERHAHPLLSHAVAVLAPLTAATPDTSPLDAIALPRVRAAQGAVLSAAGIKEHYEAALRAHGISDWRVVVDAPGERVTFNTNHELQTIFVPHDSDLALRKQPPTELRVAAAIAHEVGVHVLRRMRGLASPLALLGVGLAGYLRGEEGAATFAGQVVQGASELSGCGGYLAVGWAVGIDGTPRTFRSLHTLLAAYYLVRRLDGEEADRERDWDAYGARASRQAWARCVRTFRGTTGASPGACATKDLVYLEGNAALLELIQHEPRWQDWMLLGKYDPANESHRALLTELGMLKA